MKTLVDVVSQYARGGIQKEELRDELSKVNLYYPEQPSYEELKPTDKIEWRSGDGNSWVEAKELLETDPLVTKDHLRTVLETIMTLDR